MTTPNITVEETKEEFTNPDFNFKVILIGETAVGKTCLMLRAARGEFKEDHTVTLGADFLNYYLKINSKSAKLQLWDTCGLELYRSMIRVFFKGSDAAFLVFDVTNEKSFSFLPSWLKELKENTTPDVVCFLIGNKIDKENRVVTTETAVEFLEKNKLAGYFETSAKSGEGIKELITKVVQELYTKKGNQEKPPNILIDPSTKIKKGCACQNIIYY